VEKNNISSLTKFKLAEAVKLYKNNKGKTALDNSLTDEKILVVKL